MGAEVIEVWGTWEELLLGGAVLRHGTRDWNLVAAELRGRTVCPYTVTPEMCKAHYEDLQQRFYGCKAWFEELRKQRMAELKRALELSENSIGSLESKLETLKAERGNDCQVDNDCSQTESPVPCQKSDAVVCSSKETSKDGLSAGSFTRETRTHWSPVSQIPAAVAAEEMETKTEGLLSSEQEKVSSSEKITAIVCGGQVGSLKKRRGKRKRKDCSRDVKEGSVGESDFLGVPDAKPGSRRKENSTPVSGQFARSSGADDQSGSLRKDSIDDIKGVFESVAQNESAFVFRHRLDSQKRGRYKKMILRHMDVDTIRSKISSHSIMSIKELFRDLLLLANNAVVFYSKNTREHKSAFLLRTIVLKTMRQYFKDNEYGNKPTTSFLSPSSPLHKPPVKPRTARPGRSKLSLKAANAGNPADKPLSRAKKPSNVDSPSSMESLTLTKKSLSRKVGRTNASQRAESATRGRKRSRAS